MMTPTRIAAYIIAAQVTLAAPFALAGVTMPHAHADACTLASAPNSSVLVCLPACRYEDGNPDGLPCLWISPRTGLVYYNDGSEYRN